MTLSEKSAYLKGLMEGMKLDTETNEGKLISEIISMLQDVAENVSDLEEVVDCISMSSTASKRISTTSTIT